MRFLIAVMHDSAEFATAEEMAAIDVFNAMLIAKGYWILAAGIESPDSTVVIDNRGAQPVITNGPLVPAPVWMVGFWIIEVPSREVALALAEEGSRACNRRLELRAFL